jgi:DNA polymerase bacteriophage-type
MRVLFHDFETRSTLDLGEVGAWKYARSPCTDVWCCAYAVDDKPIQLWLPGDPVPPELIEAANNPEWITSAFGDHFERLITRHLMVPRYGWPLIPLERRRCTQAAALALALPAKLKSVADALELEQQKDERGHRVMMQMAKPRRPRQDEDPNGVYWFDDPERREQLHVYCKQDVATERALYHRIEGLIPEEQALWALDAVINNRGIHIDGKLLDAAITISEAAERAINTELQTITEGALDTIHQTARLMTWLARQGCVVTDVQKTTLQRALTRKDIAPAARRVLELRLDGAHAAAAKLLTMRAWRNGDGRARGCFRFHGASTGRWTSFGIQLQNFKRPLVEDMGAAIEAVSTGSLEHLRQCYPQPMSVVGDITRALISAAPGHRLIAADFSGIESRLTAWISGQQDKLDRWTKFDRTSDPHDEPYYVLGRTLGIAPERARTIGKTADLAFGYMGGVGAWKKLAPDDDTSADAEIKQRQKAWQRAHPNTVKFWGRLNRAAIQAVRKPNTVMTCGRVAFECDGMFLRMRLPSGRKLAYPFPQLRADDRGNLAVVFMDNAGGKWTECRRGHGAYGGTWIENAVQAVARDLFAAAMPRLEAAGYRIVLHVHDEIVAEVPNDFGSAEEFLQILTTAPAWAEGLPIAAKVREGPRFCKITKPQPQPATELDESKTAVSAPAVDTHQNEPSRPAEPVMTNATPGPEIPQSNPQDVPPWVEALASGPQPEQQINGGNTMERVDPTRGGNGDARGLPHVNGAPPTSPTAVPPGIGASSRHGGNGAQWPMRTDGSKAEAERNTYAEEHAGKPFNDAFLLRQGYRLAHVFDYTLADGTLLYWQNRYELKSGITPTKEKPRKRFLPHRIVNGKDVFGAGDRLVPYNWPAIMRAGPGSTVFVVEGELKAKILIDPGLLATTVLSHKWTPESVAALTGDHVMILADHDQDGEKLAAAAQKKLAPLAASTRIVPAAHLWKHLPGQPEPKPHNDVWNWVVEHKGDPAKLLDICREIPAEGDITAPFPFIDMSNWDAEPVPEQEWIVFGRIPRRQSVIFSGEGGAGKSIILLNLSAVAPINREWLGVIPEQGPSFFIDCEDDENVMHYRLAAIAQHYNVSFTDLIRNGLHLTSLVGQDTVMATVSRSGIVEPTPLYQRLLQAAGDIKPVIIGIAASANVFAGDENNRTQVQQFINLTTRLAIVANGTVVLITHPSNTGITSGTGLSGSTQWHNAVRARFYLKGVKAEPGEQPDTDLREIEFKKNQYGAMPENIPLCWQDGMFLPIDGVTFDRAEQEARADEVFLELLKRFTAENRHVSCSLGSTYAPALFTKEEVAKKAHLSSAQLAGAMRRLFETSKIHNEPHGKASRPRYHLAIKQP